MHRMKSCLLLPALLLSTPGIVYAQSEQAVYQKLLDGLRTEVRILSSITDADSAHTALPELKKTMQALEALNNEVEEKQLWNYLENTTDVKQPLLDELERLFGELQRIEKARYFGSKQLMQQLAPMVNPAA